MARGSLTGLVLVLAVLGPQTTAAQERVREEQADSAARDTVVQDTAVSDTVHPPRPSLGYDPAAFSLAIDIGTPGGGDAQRQPVRAWQLDYTGTPVDSALLARTVTIRGGVYGGVSGTLGLGRDWAIRLGLGLTTATLQAHYGGDAEAFVDRANATADVTADLRRLSIESALQYRIPSQRRVQPYLELGATFSRWQTRGSVPESLRLDAGTQLEATAGVGAVIPLSRRFSARLHASTRLLRTPVRPRAAGDTLATSFSPGWPPTRKEESETTVLVYRPPASALFADGAAEMLSMLRFQAGISYDLGRPAPGATAAPVTDAPADTTSPPGRSPGPER